MLLRGEEPPSKAGASGISVAPPQPLEEEIPSEVAILPAEPIPPEAVTPLEVAPPKESATPPVPEIKEPAVTPEAEGGDEEEALPAIPPVRHVPTPEAHRTPLEEQPLRIEMAESVITDALVAPRPAFEAPAFRSRRPQPPKAQPPAQLLRQPAAPPPQQPAAQVLSQQPLRSTPQQPAGNVQSPLKSAPENRVMSNPPPAEVIVKPEPEFTPPSELRSALASSPPEERELPSQIGEWPPRRPRAMELNPWKRLMVFSLAVFTFTVVTWIYWQDDKPPSEETLQLNRDFDDSPRPAAIARMRAVLTSVAPVQRAEIVSIPPWLWEGPDLAKMVEANGLARENLRDLLEEPDWHPRHKAWFEEDIGSHGAWTSLAILKQAEAAYLMRRGEEEAAFTAAIDLAELARSMQELDAWPSFYDRSLFIFERASQTLVELLRTTKLDFERLGAFQDEYQRCAPSDAVLRAAMSAWYLHEKKLMLGPESREAIDTLPGGLVYQRPGRLFFKPSRTLQLFAKSFNDLRDEAERPPYSRSSQIALRLSRMGPNVGLPNSAGDAYFAGRIAPYVSFPNRQSIARAQHAVVVTLFAITRFRVEYQRLPDRLVNLRPFYLKDLPVDPFSGESLKYDIGTGIVSSVGANFTPDPGTPAEPPFSDPKEISAQAGR